MLGFRTVECPVTFRDGEYVRLVERERGAEREGEKLGDVWGGDLDEWLRQVTERLNTLKREA